MRTVYLFFYTALIFFQSLQASDLNASLRGPVFERQTQRPTLITLGVDGIYTPLLQAMVEGGMLPAFRKIRDMSAHTFQAHTIYRPHSFIVWSAFLYGRQPSFLSKVKDTFLDVNRFEVAERNYGKTNLCRVLGDASSTGVVTNWPTLSQVIPKDETTVRVINLLGNGATQPDSVVFETVNSMINRKLYRSIFAHLDYSDYIASENGIYDGSYSRALVEVDKGLASILDNPNLDFRTRDYLCITSDHGRDTASEGKKHDCLLKKEVRDVPFFVVGPGVTPHVVRESVSIIDIVPSVLSLMGYGRGDMEGRVINFRR